MDSFDKAFAHFPNNPPVKQDRISDISELMSPTIQRVRGEFLDDTFMPKIHIAHKSMALSPSCIKLFPDCQHFAVYLDEENVRLIVIPTTVEDKNGLKFSNVKNGKIVPRLCTAKHFCQRLFEFMEWDSVAKYRILANYQEVGNRKVMLFSLRDALQVRSSIVEGEDGKKKRHTTINMPLEWEGTFGDTLDVLEKKNRVDFNSPLIAVDHKTGEVIRLVCW